VLGRPSDRSGRRDGSLMPKLPGRPRDVFTRRGVVRPPYNPALAKYWRNRRELFTKYDMGCALDAEGWYSATPEAAASATSKHLDRSLSPLSFVDAFVGTGGNAIQQALHDPFGVVIAVDVDPMKIAMAQHNAKIYGVHRRIEFICGDFVALAPRLRAHVCFLSPPWGGPDYDVQQDGGFHLSSLAHGNLGIDGEHIFELACEIAPTVGFYLPVSTPDVELAQLAAQHASGRCERVHLIWGGGKKVRPRALLACFHERRSEAEEPTGVQLSTVHCGQREASFSATPPQPAVATHKAEVEVLGTHIRFSDFDEPPQPAVATQKPEAEALGTHIRFSEFDEQCALLVWPRA